MKKFKKILVGLDLSPLDEKLINKTAELAQIFGTEMVYFVHVAKDLTIPAEISKEYPNLKGSADEKIEKEISELVAASNLPQNVQYEVEAKEGNPLDKILRWSKVKNVDLIIMGRKSELEGSGALAKRIALKSPCSVLFLTEKMNTAPFKNILVPIDFSSYSLLTLKYAQKITEDHALIKCFHLFDIPHGYSKTGKTYEEFVEIMRENSQKDYEKFIRTNKLPDFPCELQVRDKGNRESLLLEKAKEEGVGLIVIGSRGRSDSAALLIGSIAEKLININNEIPMLVIKKKGENMRFFEALFRI